MHFFLYLILFISPFSWGMQAPETHWFTQDLPNSKCKKTQLACTADDHSSCAQCKWWRQLPEPKIQTIDLSGCKDSANNAPAIPATRVTQTPYCATIPNAFEYSDPALKIYRLPNPFNGDIDVARKALPIFKNDGRLLPHWIIKYTIARNYLNLLKLYDDNGFLPQEINVSEEPNHAPHAPAMPFYISILSAAARANRDDIVHYLVDKKKMNPHQKERITGLTPVQYAFRDNNNRALAALLHYPQFPLDSAQKTPEGFTAYQIADNANNAKALKILDRHVTALKTYQKAIASPQSAVVTFNRAYCESCNFLAIIDGLVTDK